jgi:fumarate reductase subunit D
MDPGLILLVFLALLVAFGWSRLRRRAGMGNTAKSWLTVMAVFIIAVLALWAYSTHRGG